jgi:Ca2+-binding EF-hand superfamily protein
MAAVGERMTSRDPGSRFFDRFDTDKDGAISAEEYAAAEQFMQMIGGKRGGKQGHKGGNGRN